MTDIVFGVDGDKVVMSWREPTKFVVFDSQNAFEFAEKLARTAHRAKFGKEPPTDRSYLAQQVRARLTDEKRDRLVVRVSIMLTSLLTQAKSPGQIAMHVVDAVLREAA